MMQKYREEEEQQQLLTRANCCNPAEHDPNAAAPGYSPLSEPIKEDKKTIEPPDFWSRILRQTAFIRNHEAIIFILTIFLNSSSDSWRTSCMGPACNAVQLTHFTVEELLKKLFILSITIQ